MTVRLQVLGPVSAAVIGDETARLTQPRLLALLAYLALARPRGLHSRDTLVALLWPDADESAGRQGLRNALHRLRASLGDDVIVTAGESFIGVDASLVDCDALTLEGVIADRRWSDAIALYTGELLQGFHVSGAAGFERWLDAERALLRDTVIAAAWSDADSRRLLGDLTGAIRSAQRACSLAPDDEASMRRLLELMDAAGDRGAALRVYDEFARRLKDDLDVEPSTATQDAIQRIRRSAAPNAAGPPSTARPVPPARSLSTEPSPARPLAPEQARPSRRAIVVGLLALLLVIPSSMWFTRSERIANAPSEGRRSNGAEGPGAELSARWRADTALLGRYLRARAQRASLEVPAARRSFMALVDEAPLYGPAWAGLAVTQYRSAFFDTPSREAMPRALAAATKALSLDSTLVGAHEALVAYDMWGRWDLAGAKRRLDRALALHPDDPDLNNLLATWHRWRGEFEQSMQLKQRTRSLDPLSSRYAYQIAASLYFAHRCEEAVAVFRRLPAETRRSRPGSQLQRYLACAGRDDEAADAMRESLLGGGDSILARAFAPPLTPARRDAALQAVFRSRLARELETRRRSWTPAERIMAQYAEMRDADSTLMWLDSMYVERSMMLYVVPFDPLNDFLRSDPRFDAFVKRLPWYAGFGPSERSWIDTLRVRSTTLQWKGSPLP